MPIDGWERELKRPLDMSILVEETQVGHSSATVASAVFLLALFTILTFLPQCEPPEYMELCKAMIMASSELVLPHAPALPP